MLKGRAIACIAKSNVAAGDRRRAATRLITAFKGRLLVGSSWQLEHNCWALLVIEI